MKPRRFKNNKNGGIYTAELFGAINSTNAQDGQVMVVYSKMEEGVGRSIFVREEKEFYEKFTEVTD